MRNFKFYSFFMSILILLSGCGASNTTKGGLIGGGGGAAVGALIGNLVRGKSDKGKGTAIGAAAAAVENAQVETVTDANGLAAVKVTFNSGILFATNKSDLNSSAKASLSDFANVLKTYNDADVAIVGHTDNTGTDAINNPLSLKRAQSVESYLKSCGVTTGQIASVEGKGSTEPVADNATAAGRTQNRRVEVYLYASQEMINAANAGTLK